MYTHAYIYIYIVLIGICAYVCIYIYIYMYIGHGCLGAWASRVLQGPDGRAPPVYLTDVVLL